MAPKLSKLKSPNKSPPKGSSLLLDHPQKVAITPLAATAGPDPFASKKGVLGAISPQKCNDIDIISPKLNRTTGDIAPLRPENGLEDEENNETQRQHQREVALLEAEEILAAEIKLEEDQTQAELNARRESDEEAKTDAEEMVRESHSLGLLDADDDFNRLTQADDEFHEATVLAAQEAKINQALHRRGKNHLAAYQHPISALSLDVPLLRAVFKDDIDTVKQVHMS